MDRDAVTPWWPQQKRPPTLATARGLRELAYHARVREKDPSLQPRLSSQTHQRTNTPPFLLCSMLARSKTIAPTSTAPPVRLSRLLAVGEIDLVWAMFAAFFFAVRPATPALSTQQMRKRPARTRRDGSWAAEDVRGPSRRLGRPRRRHPLFCARERRRPRRSPTTFSRPAAPCTRTGRRPSRPARAPRPSCTPRATAARPRPRLRASYGPTCTRKGPRRWPPTRPRGRRRVPQRVPPGLRAKTPPRGPPQVYRCRW